jgi:hypothetical protein
MSERVAQLQRIRAIPRGHRDGHLDNTFMFEPYAIVLGQRWIEDRRLEFLISEFIHAFMPHKRRKMRHVGSKGTFDISFSASKHERKPDRI